MGLDEMQAVVARLLTDPQYRQRFFASDASADAFGLSSREFGHLRNLDPRRLDISSEGYVGKRFERLAGVFPRTLALYVAIHPHARSEYVAQTAFPGSEAEEYATFQAHLERWSAPEDAKRALLDLRDLEWALHSTPPAPLRPYRFRRGETRPIRSATAVTLRARGPLELLLAAGPAAEYPSDESEWIVIARAPNVRVERLEGLAGAVWRRCDGARTVERIAREAGPEAEALVVTWLAAGVLDDERIT